MKEVDFADSAILQTLFEYKLKDERDQFELATEVAKEYHSGKLDPLAALKMERQRKRDEHKMKQYSWQHD